MSSVQAVTQNIAFTARVASFRPLNEELLVIAFSAWLEEKSKEQNFLVYSFGLECEAKGYAP
jgi:hypothetical protein